MPQVGTVGDVNKDIWIVHVDAKILDRVALLVHNGTGGDLKYMNKTCRLTYKHTKWNTETQMNTQIYKRIALYS